MAFTYGTIGPTITVDDGSVNTTATSFVHVVDPGATTVLFFLFLEGNELDPPDTVSGFIRLNGLDADRVVVGEPTFNVGEVRGGLWKWDLHTSGAVIPLPIPNGTVDVDFGGTVNPYSITVVNIINGRVWDDRTDARVTEYTDPVTHLVEEGYKPRAERPLIISAAAMKGFNTLPSLEVNTVTENERSTGGSTTNDFAVVVGKKDPQSYVASEQDIGWDMNQAGRGAIITIEMTAVGEVVIGDTRSTGFTSPLLRNNARSWIVWKKTNVGFFFYYDSPSPGALGAFAYKKTSDGGLTWGAAVPIPFQSLGSGEQGAMGVWFDDWTPDDCGRTVHVMIQQNRNASYVAFDTISETFGTPVGIFALFGIQTDQRDCNASITKTRNGRLYAIWWGTRDVATDVNAAPPRMKASDDGGLTWGADLSTFLIFQQTNNNENDVWLAPAPDTNGVPSTDGIVACTQDNAFGGSTRWARWRYNVGADTWTLLGSIDETAFVPADQFKDKVSLAPVNSDHSVDFSGWKPETVDPDSPLNSNNPILRLPAANSGGSFAFSDICSPGKPSLLHRTGTVGNERALFGLSFTAAHWQSEVEPGLTDDRTPTWYYLNANYDKTLQIGRAQGAYTEHERLGQNLGIGREGGNILPIYLRNDTQQWICNPEQQAAINGTGTEVCAAGLGEATGSCTLTDATVTPAQALGEGVATAEAALTSQPASTLAEAFACGSATGVATLTEEQGTTDAAFACGSATAFASLTSQPASTLAEAFACGSATGVATLTSLPNTTQAEAFAFGSASAVGGLTSQPASTPAEAFAVGSATAVGSLTFQGQTAAEAFGTGIATATGSLTFRPASTPAGALGFGGATAVAALTFQVGNTEASAFACAAATGTANLTSLGVSDSSIAVAVAGAEARASLTRSSGLTGQVECDVKIGGATV